MAGMLYGLFLSSICADEQECVQYSTGSFFPVMLLSGILWPVEGIPGFLRYVGVRVQGACVFQTRLAHPDVDPISVLSYLTPRPVHV